uniref:Putative reverse transcriptase domain-containing protein n=1 Tax=Tanacetum cinerariifolium TaxID=118510 RepID=A0A6L2MQX2_TANCI|nr:putative reverse transcriptase domain-containing protein [Tanacetum cinerariifolium]
MPTMRQGMSSAKIEQIVAQRVTNAIEAIAIYETKIYVDHDLIVRDIRHGAKVARNANNIRKWEGERKPCISGANTKNKTGKKSKEKRLEDVPIVLDFPEVITEDFPRFSSTRQVKFQIDLILDATPVAQSPYRLSLWPLEMQELSNQLQELPGKGFIRLSSPP